MHAFMTAKVRPFLVISSVLAVWILLAAQPAQAHDRGTRLPSLSSCSNLPDAAFFTTPTTTLPSVAIRSDGFTGASSPTKRGGGTSGRGGDKYRYAKITVPALTAGELRVFDATEATGTPAIVPPSDALLCRGSTTVARSITSYTAHDSAYSNATSASNSAKTVYNAGIFGDYNDDTDSDGEDDGTAGNDARDGVTRTKDTAIDATSFSAVSGALTRVRRGLNTARTALTAAVRALNTAAKADPDSASIIEGYITSAANAEQDASTAYNDTVTADGDTTGTNPVYSPGATNEQKLPIAKQALDNALSALGFGAGTSAVALADATGAIGALNTASTNLRTNAAPLAHAGFKLRAQVEPGDEEYIVVVASENAATDLNFAYTFNGAIDSTSVSATPAGTQKIEASLTSAKVDRYMLTVTAPGLLTVETTGSTDTIGALDLTTGAVGEVAQAESGDSGDNFKIIVPVIAGSYTLEVEGQTSRTTGAYALDMDFKVAMQGATPTTSSADDPVIGPAAPTWTNTPLSDDDDTDNTPPFQIRKVAETSADEDYFVFSVETPGLLTVNANNDSVGSTTDANTKGTLFGAMGEGPMMEQRVGQIATDADSGPSGHFQFTVPVEANRQYLVKVEGTTEGAYILEFDFTEVTDTDNDDTNDVGQEPITPPAAPISGILAERGAHLYLFSIEEPGTLYAHTTGETDVYGTLYGPDGKNIAEDNDSGDDRNFRIAVQVAPGVYILEVKGNRVTTAGDYTLVTNFVTGPGPDPTTPTTPTTPEPEPTDATGSLDDPPNNGSRSGIGLIRGWVCQATSVEVVIRGPREGGQQVVFTIPTPYGSVREQAAIDQCQHTSRNIGFAAQFNYNILEEGTYTAEARADGETIETNTFEVIRISDQVYLEGVGEEVVVRDFPRTGDTLTLEWDEASQNFQIVDHQ